VLNSNPVRFSTFHVYDPCLAYTLESTYGKGTERSELGYIFYTGLLTLDSFEEMGLSLGMLEGLWKYYQYVILYHFPAASVKCSPGTFQAKDLPEM
jgi:hypothetical protein